MNSVPLRKVSSVRAGDHVCFPYESDAAHMALLGAFIVDGLDRNERVLYFTDNQPTQPLISDLQTLGIDVDRHVTRGRLAFATSEQSYLAAGHFDPDACVNGWLATATQAVNNGYTGIRVAGDMGWATRGVPGVDRLLEYERRVQSEVFSSGLVTGMCEFDMRRFDEDTVEAMLAVHPDGVLGSGACTDYGNFQMMPTFEPYGARVFGEIDAHCEEKFRATLDCLAGTGVADIHIDFAAVRFMGATALSTLARFVHGLQEDRRVIVLNMAPKFRQLMTALELDGVPRLLFFETVL